MFGVRARIKQVADFVTLEHSISCETEPCTLLAHRLAICLGL
jgi:hypothetical protein